MQKRECGLHHTTQTQNRVLRRLRPLTGGLLILILAWLFLGSMAQKSEAKEGLVGGELEIVDEAGQKTGFCPLQHTEVEANIIGFVGRVRVRQTFYNPLPSKIEAVYVFPLPQNAAVDNMVMRVGDQRILGQVKPRDEARAIYEAARSAGHVASLLDQERPNIFTQTVANIEPGAQVVIEISYVETLTYEDGVFEFMFPMVVGPRYMPGTPTNKQGTGWAPDTTEVPDASKISPPVTPPETRAGHDISLTVHLNAGMKIYDLESVLHEVQIDRTAPGQATVKLAKRTEIPNRDFILRYRTATEEIADAFLVHADDRGTFFTLMVQPPRHVRPRQAVPKEMIFVIDRSGSMRGFPIEKAKETMRLAIQQMNPHDTFNLLSFSGGTGRCFPKPVPNTPRNRAIALKYLADLYGSGGTQMMPAILEALGGDHNPERIRIVAFMTDGYIGNDFAIMDAVRNHAGTSRVFAFGIGNAVNRFLLAGMAHAGRGAVEYVTLQSQGEGAAKRFRDRIHTPVLTDIVVDWGNLPVTEVYPKQIPDLFSNKPILIHGRLTGPADGTLVLRGNTAGGPLARRIRLRPSAPVKQHDALASLWARAKVKDLMMRDYAAVQRGDASQQMQHEITALGVEFRLITQFTSFVAVEEMTVSVAGKLVTIAVPVEMPAGVSYEGVFGQKAAAKLPTAPPSAHGFSGALTLQRQALPSAAMLRAEELSANRGTGEDEAKQPSSKLSASLRGLAEQVAREGNNGTLTTDNLRVLDYRVDVMVYLRDTSDATLAALQELGLVKTGESKTIRLVIGSIDVRRLEKLAQIDTVLRVTPVSG